MRQATLSSDIIMLFWGGTKHGIWDAVCPHTKNTTDIPESLRLPQYLPSLRVLSRRDFPATQIPVTTYRREQFILRGIGVIHVYAEKESILPMLKPPPKERRYSNENESATILCYDCKRDILFARQGHCLPLMLIAPRTIPVLLTQLSHCCDCAQRRQRASQVGPR